MRTTIPPALRISEAMAQKTVTAETSNSPRGIVVATSVVVASARAGKSRPVERAEAGAGRSVAEWDALAASLASDGIGCDCSAAHDVGPGLRVGGGDCERARGQRCAPDSSGVLVAGAYRAAVARGLSTITSGADARARARASAPRARAGPCRSIVSNGLSARAARGIEVRPTPSAARPARSGGVPRGASGGQPVVGEHALDEADHPLARPGFGTDGSRRFRNSCGAPG
jgi:hypothetical protein